jgi:hypothetical protein
MSDTTNGSPRSLLRAMRAARRSRNLPMGVGTVLSLGIIAQLWGAGGGGARFSAPRPTKIRQVKPFVAFWHLSGRPGC